MTDGLFEDVRHMKGAANYCLPSIAVGASALDNAAPASPQPDATGGAGAAVTAEPAVGVSRPSTGPGGHMEPGTGRRADYIRTTGPRRAWNWSRGAWRICALSIIDDA